MKAREFEFYVHDLMQHPDVQRLRKTNAHWRRDRFSHCFAVGKLSYRMAKLFHANVTVAARGGFLHDWYHGHTPHRKRFANPDSHHFRQSVAAATSYGESPEVVQVIRTHMWPWGRTVPKTREAWIVWMADNIIWFDDIWQSLKQTIRERNIVHGAV